MPMTMGALIEDEEDLILAAAFSPQQVNEITGTRGPDVLTGTPGPDLIRGLAGDDQISGRGGDDELHGGRGNDELHGGPGHDRIFGGLGNDRIFGGRGPDVLDGGAGRNELTGGPGADTFRFTIIPSNEQNIDRVLDFDPAADRFNLRPLLPGFQAGDDFSQFVQFTPLDVDTRLAVDPNGAGNFQPIALLSNVLIAALPASQLGLPGPRPGTDFTIASTNPAGVAGNGVSYIPSLSADGRLVSFASSATNFIADDTPTFDVFVKDLQSGAIERVSETAQGVGGNAGSFSSAISADGARVAFDSLANNFPGDPNPSLDQRDAFIADRSDGSLRFVSIENNTFATLPSLSADGTRVAFQATATGRAETPDPAGPSIPRIFVRDLTDGSLIEASTSAGGQSANDLSLFSDISANGRFVAFDSGASNLVPDDANPTFDVFRKNIETGRIALVSIDADGSQDPGRPASAPSISADGRFVAFQTTARLVEDDFDNVLDVYWKDMRTGEIVLVSRSAAGVKGNDESLSPSISDDGNLIAFRSAASNLVPGDDNGVHDIFVKNLTTGDILRFEVAGDTSGLALVQAMSLLRPSLSGDGTTVAFSDQIEVAAGTVVAGQVAVAPVEFGAGAVGLASLDPLLAPQDVVSL